MNQIIRHSLTVDRYCSRCGLPLEDAASRECGQGPICRKKNNDIFARQIPAEMAKASMYILSMRADNFHPEISSSFEEIRNLYLQKAEKVARENIGSVPIVLSGADFRKIIDWFDLSLSYPSQQEHRNNVINFIECLGYQALAGILRGDVCMSPAKLFIENDFIYLKAKSNKTGFFAMKRTIPGVITPKYRGDQTPYKCSIKHIKKFIEVAYRYWPFIESSDAVDSLLKAVETNPIADTFIDDSKPVATVQMDSSWFTVTAPWFGTRDEMYAMINEFKKVYYKDRKYDPTTHNWSFKLNCQEHILTILKNRYNIIINEMV